MSIVQKLTKLHHFQKMGRKSDSLHCKLLSYMASVDTENSHRTSRIQTKHSFKVIENTDIDTTSSTFKENKSFIERVMEKYHDVLKKAMTPAHDKALKRHKDQNKLFMEERLNNLLDDRSEFMEFSPLAGINMEYGEIPRAGAITGIGKVCGQYCVVMVNDGTIKGGTIYPITLKKQLRCQEIAEQNRLPCLYVIDSGGAFLPLQSDIFPDKNHGGRVFYNLAVMSSQSIPQVSVVVGNCTAGGAYIPMMSDEAIIVHQVGRIFLGGPPLVLAATGEVITAEELGGATMHSSVSGCTDYFSETEEAAYVTCRDVMSTITSPNLAQIDHNPGYIEPCQDQHELYGLIPPIDQHNIDVYRVIARIVDGSRLHEFKKLFGATLVTGYAHIEGTLVGIVGNNGELTEQAADKGAHFIKLCSERNVPLIFLQNIHPTDGQSTSSHGPTCGAKIKCQSKMLSEVSCSHVPKVTVIIGNSFGVPAYAMGGRSLGVNFTFLWPNARVSLMDPASLAQSTQESGGRVREDEVEKIKQRIEEQSSALYSSCNLWDDGIIEPHNTRQVLGKCLSIFKHRLPETTHHNTPIIRM